mgnify:FL=1
MSRFIIIIITLQNIILGNGFFSGLYGSYSYRSFKIDDELGNILSSDIDYYDTGDYLTSISNSGYGHIFTIGYKNFDDIVINKNKYAIYKNYFLSEEINNFEYGGYFAEQNKFYNNNSTEDYWVCFGLGYGLISQSGINYKLDFIYNYPMGDEYIGGLGQLLRPDDSYFSLRLSIGLSKKTKWGPWGASVSKSLNKHLLRKTYPTINTSQYNFEAPVIMIAGGALIYGALAILVGGDYSANPLSPINQKEYNYNVSGYGSNGEYVSGNVDSNADSNFVNGYITLEDGNIVSFSGEWIGKGLIEGYDENGDYYELEVD